MKMKKVAAVALSVSLAVGMLGHIPVAAAETDSTAHIMRGEVIPGEALGREEVNFKEYNGYAEAMYDVTGRNRIEAHTDAVIPYQDEQAALRGASHYAKESSDYIQMLTGENALNKWKLTVVKNLKEADASGLTGNGGTENPFAQTAFEEQGDKWKEVVLPGSWTMQGDWDYAIYTNNKMPWQEDEKPYGDRPYSFFGTLSPGEAPVTYNPIGFYRTKFTLGDSMKHEGNRIRISFQGVESAYYVFVNGQAVGYSEDTFRCHEFDITDFLTEGENTLAVRVHKFNDSTWLEDQDMIYDGGIFRDVYLVSVPEVSVEDYKVETDFDENYEDASLVIRGLTLKNNTADTIPEGYRVSVRLFEDETDAAPQEIMDFTTSAEIPAYGKYVFEEGKNTVRRPRQWSAEKPELYLLSFNAAKPGEEKTYAHTAQLLGFREISFTMTQTDGNRKNTTESYDRIRINGQPLLMKGVNRHDSDPVHGKYISKGVYETDVKLMKQYNINTIRTSHYANDEYLYYLADKYGMYIMAEANLECHGVTYGRDGKGYYGRELRKTFEDRTVTSYQTLKNHSAVVSWSIGNECGTSRTSDADVLEVYNWMVDYYHDRDASRFVHAEFMQEDTSVDLKSNMYPSPENVQKWAVTPDQQTTDTNRNGMPYFLCEYAHAMGNAAGSLSDYWNAIRSGTNMAGACIWDWTDQSRIVSLEAVTGTGTTATGKVKVAHPWDYNASEDAYRYLYGDELKDAKVFFGYGGDFGDVNNHNDFCVNGLVSPDRQPQPELYEVKYQYQSFWMVETPVYEQQQLKGWTTDEDLKEKQIVVYNENNFTDLNEFQLRWKLKEDGTVIDSGLITDLPSVKPKQTGRVSIPFTLPEQKTAGAKYFLDVEIVTKEEDFARKSGYEVAHEQFALPESGIKAQGPSVGGEGLQVTEEEDRYDVAGNDFSFSILKQNGVLTNYKYHGELLIEEGPRPNYWRAPHNNDGMIDGNWRYAGRDSSVSVDPDTLSVQTAKDGRKVIDVGMKLAVGANKAGQTIRYTVDQSGAVEVTIVLDTRKVESDRTILKIGSQMKLPGDYERVLWYGNGYRFGEDYEYGYKYPVPEGYSDRSTYAVQGIFHTTVSDMFFPHIRTQESGTVNGVNWIGLESEEKDTALLISGRQQMEASALHWNAEEMHNIRHPYEFQEKGNATYLNIDYGSRGIGNDSCGPTALAQYCLQVGEVYRYEYTILPVQKADAEKYGELHRMWNAAAETGIAEPMVPEEIGFVGAAEQGGSFPSEVLIEGEKKTVQWEKTPKDYRPYEKVEVKGSVKDSGQLIRAEFEIIPDGMVYYVDCNDSDKTVFDCVRKTASELKNETPDQRWSDGKTWGITSSAENYGTPGSGVKAGDKYMTGYYLQKQNILDYMFTLKAGTYVVTVGFQEFWPNNAERRMLLSVMDGASNVLGETQASLNGKNGKLQEVSEIEFTVPSDGQVTFRLSKAGGADPVISWLAIAEQKGSLQDSYSVVSPEGKTSARFWLDSQGTPMYEVKYGEKQVVEESAMGFELEAGDSSIVYNRGFSLKGVSRDKQDTVWENPFGDLKRVPDRYEELTLNYETEDGIAIDVICRAYEEGIAFRYAFPQDEKRGSLKILQELTYFNLDNSADAYVHQNRNQTRVTKVPVSELKAVDKGYFRPLVVIGDGYAMSVTEANQIDYTRVHFTVDENCEAGTLRTVFNGTSDNVDLDAANRVDMVTADISTRAFDTPWRVFILGSNEGEVVENNYLVKNLNPPCALEDTSWITPGISIRASTDTAGGMQAIDFAAEHGYEYVHFDASWYGPEGNQNSDPWTCKDDFDLDEISKYADEKGIRLMVYINFRHLEDQYKKGTLGDLFKMYKETWGIDGIKFGFVPVGSQASTKMVYEWVKIAAENKMIVDIHDEMLPTGYERTYPNLLTYEAIYGDEMNPDPKSDLGYLFTRMTAGQADHTWCFALERNTSKAFRVAGSLVFFSPLIFPYWYDNKGLNQIQVSDGTGMWDVMPTVWDESHMLEAKMQEYAVVSRRSGDDWYVAGISAAEHELKIPLTMLQAGRIYKAEIYTNRTDNMDRISSVTCLVDSSDVLSARLGHNYGYAVKLSPANAEESASLPSFVDESAAAEALISRIARLEAVTAYNLEQTEQEIADIRSEYGKLDELQKICVSNFKRVLDAEAVISRIRTAPVKALLINGEPMEHFDPGTESYQITLCGDAELPQVSCEAYGESQIMEIRQAASIPGDAHVTVKNPFVTKIYTIRFVVPSGADVLYASDFDADSYGMDGRKEFKKDTDRNNGVLTLYNEKGEKETFDKGIGTHANTNIYFDIDGKGISTFQAVCGVSANNGKDSNNVRFKVYKNERTEENLMFDSGNMTQKTPYQTIDLDISGSSVLILEANDGGDGISNDHANWCDAKFIMSSVNTAAIDRMVQRAEALAAVQADGAQKDALRQEIAKANEVKETEGITYQDVYMAALKVRDAITGILKQQNMQLQELVDLCKEAVQGSNPGDVWEEFLAAFNAAQNTLQDLDAGKEDAGKSYRSLKEQADLLKIGQETVGKKFLKMVYAAYEELDLAAFTAESADALEKALGDAEKVLSNGALPEEEYEKAAAAILKAAAGLVTDTGSLVNAVQAANSLADKANNLAESLKGQVSGMAGDVEAAKNLAEAAQAAAQTAQNIAALAKREAQKSMLSMVYEAYRNLDLSIYTKESADALSKAILRAGEILQDQNAPDEQFEEAGTAVLKAAASLSEDHTARTQEMEAIKQAALEAQKQAENQKRELEKLSAQAAEALKKAEEAKAALGSTLPQEQKAQKGTVYTVGKYRYKVLSVKKRKAEVIGQTDTGLKKLAIPDQIKLFGEAYTVTSIGKSAFSENRKITDIVIGKNVKSIGKKAFYNCRGVKSIQIKSKVLKSVGSNVFKGIHKRAVIKVPAKQYADYKRLLAKKGQGAQVKIKKK